MKWEIFQKLVFKNLTSLSIIEYVYSSVFDSIFIKAKDRSNEKSYVKYIILLLC